MMLYPVSSSNNPSMVSLAGGNGRFQAGAEAAGSKKVMTRNLKRRCSQPSPSFQVTDKEQNVVRQLAPGYLVNTGHP